MLWHLLVIDMAQSDMTACYVVYGCMKSYKVAKEYSEAKGDHKPSKESKV